MQRCAQHDEIQNHILDGTTLSALAHGRSQTHTTITGMAGIAMYLCLYIYCMYDVYVHRAVPCGTPFVQIGWLQKRTVVIYMNARHWTTLFDCVLSLVRTAMAGCIRRAPANAKNNQNIAHSCRIHLLLLLCALYYFSSCVATAMEGSWRCGRTGWKKAIPDGLKPVKLLAVRRVQ